MAVVFLCAIRTMLAIEPWTAAVGGAAMAAMLIVGCYMKRRSHLVAARKTLHGMVVLITGASSGLGEGKLRNISVDH